MAFERDDRRVRRVIELAAEYGGSLRLPSGAIGQIWRDGTWQACLARLVRSGLLDVQDLDLDEARTAGSLWGLTGTADVAEASVALLARRHQALVITSDPDDLRRLDADLQLITC